MELIQHKNITKEFEEVFVDYEIWVYNIIFHMLDCFKFTGKIDNILIKDKLPPYARLEIYKYNLTGIKFTLTDWHNVFYTVYKYKLLIDRGLVKQCYKEQIEDNSIVVNTIEFVILHEIAHIRYKSHGKRFIREYRNLIKRWYKFKGLSDKDKSIEEAVKLEKNCYKNKNIR